MEGGICLSYIKSNSMYAMKINMNRIRENTCYCVTIHAKCFVKIISLQFSQSSVRILFLLKSLLFEKYIKNRSERKQKTFKASTYNIVVSVVSFLVSTQFRNVSNILLCHLFHPVRPSANKSLTKRTEFLMWNVNLCSDIKDYRWWSSIFIH